MLHPKASEHPHYEITNKMREIWPGKCTEWEKLLEDAEDPRHKGCFTCRFYNPPNNTFVDVEFIEGHEIPWDTEEAYVNCDLLPESQALLITRCQRWREYVQK
jgi:hypothetical protein